MASVWVAYYLISVSQEATIASEVDRALKVESCESCAYSHHARLLLYSAASMHMAQSALRHVAKLRHLFFDLQAVHDNNFIAPHSTLKTDRLMGSIPTHTAGRKPRCLVWLILRLVSLDVAGMR